MVRPFFRSVLVIAGACGVTTMSGAASAGAATSGHVARAASTPATQVSRPVCTTSIDDPQRRAVTFTVRASRGATASGFGFIAVLEERSGSGKWIPLKGAASPEGLGVFQPAADGSAAMVRRITVRGLRMGSAYRLKVGFRWVTPSGTQRVTRRSSSCTIRELRPNIGIFAALPWIPGTSGDQVVYRPQVGTQRGGAFANRKVTISVLQGTTVLGRINPPSLVRGGQVLVPGAPCTAGTDVTYRVEVAPPVEESNTADNELTVPCGAGRAAGR